MRALLIEDSENDAELLLRHLRQGGYEVVHRRVETAETMESALSDDVWDIIFCDFRMPCFSAMKALDVLKASEKDLPFIVISGAIGEESAVEALKNGAHDFFVKGRLARLVPAIDRELREAASRHERRRAELALQKSEAQMRVAQRMEAIGQLTGGIAHDFNNLLTVISGNLELLERRCADDPRLAKPVASALKASRGGAELTGRLLAFARRQPLNATAVEPNQLVSATVDLMRRTLGSSIEIALHLSEDAWWIHSDASQLENCLINLAVNARDAMSSSGRLTIETSNVQLEREYAERCFDVGPGPYVMIAVTDTGSGMSPEVQGSAFEPFFSTKERGKGTGLGLSMVYGFVKQSGGHIQIYSEEDKGTTIRMYLPRSDSTGQRMPHVPSLEGEPVGGSETILVVDDDLAVREVAVEFLREFGYRVLVAEDGASTLAVLESNAEIGLLLTDIVMPGSMSGRELGLEALRRRPELPVVYVSGHSEYSVFQRDALSTRERFVAKPYSRRELAEAMRGALDCEMKK